MKAIVYKVNPLGWATCKWLRYFWPGCLRSHLNGFTLRDLPPPELPGRDWVRLRTLLGGICGSDLAIVHQKQPADSLLQAYSSQPMILGHENVAVVDQVGPDVDRALLGRRVVVEPTLGCEPRGTRPPCERCSAGQFGSCENFAGWMGGEAHLPAGTSIGYNARTGGSWGEYFVAHRSQIIDLPGELTDEQAVLVDPLAVAVHGVLRVRRDGLRRVLVYGSGIVGLGVVAALRATGFHGRIELLGRGNHLADLATRQGADEYFDLPDEPPTRFAQIAARTAGSVQKARFGNLMLSGGYDAVFDCIGSEQSVRECLKWTRSRGQLVMLGTLQTARVDLTPLWFNELTVLGAWGRQVEHHQGRSVNTYALTLDWMARELLPTQGLLTHRFSLDEYRKALDVAGRKSKHQAVKVAFDFR